MPNTMIGMSQQMRQQMTLAPQMKQSLDMLQKPVMELRTMIQHEIETNPALDEIPPSEISIDAARDSASTTDEVNLSSDFSVNNSRNSEQEQSSGKNDDDNIPDEINLDNDFETLSKLDDDFRDYIFQDGGSGEYTADMEARRQFMFDSITQPESLQEHLIAQLDLANLNASDREIAEDIIGSLDNYGYLTTPLAELAQGFGETLDHMEDVLASVQEMSPSGVGGRTLAECLLIQLRNNGRSGSLAAKIVRDHIESLAAHKIASLAATLGVSEDEIAAAISEITKLDPKPGAAFSQERDVFVLPEMEVRLHEGRYRVFLDNEQLPRLRINKEFRRMLEDKSLAQKTSSYIRERIRAGSFLIKSIRQRQETIYKIATEIVNAQQDFFKIGVTALKPLRMSEIAEKVGVHETTVSRAVSGKYMRSPRGVIELRFFFTHGVKNDDGIEISNKSVQDRIAKLITNEDKSAPLSDQAILDILKKEGLPIARRTVAKYRINLGIEPSHRRRR